VTCPSCGTENREGRKFCSECGTALASACPSCGAANEPGEKFCGECGTTLASAASTTSGAPPEATTPTAERRLVSVLFADLVGFTAASEGRDAEDTRELLTRYFEQARMTIERYGGTVEKFIGDAVMAVWGAPVAQEDDAERAVRAALDLVAGVPDLDPALSARAGVLTGEAAVTLGAEGQGMVAGDLVNTASRLQSEAEPGSVLVGETTKRSTEAAIAYTSTGERELKGKSEPMTLWRALRVVAARKGEGRAAGLEAPFVGRERELRLAKELFHATADERRAHLLSIVGVAGMGKSRLAWEFEKYLDGLMETAWWHKGRCLAYGEGVAYWALAEMVRMRARIAEDEPADESLEKLSAVVSEIVLDSEERAFVEPRLQHLLGLTDRVAPDREDLFSAWRLFFERMTDENPVIMVFEDIHWADAALLEFVEYLLDWSRAHPIYVITLARPEVSERHPGWGAHLRNYTSLTLEPLRDEAIDDLLRGLVPGLPDDAVTRIRTRADGTPLYAVETVRMLLDRGLLKRGEGGYDIAGDLPTLDVPETLQALIAARLDGLEPDERHLLQNAAVLGKTFAPRGLSAVGGVAEEALETLLPSLVRKEMLVLDSDPRSPERGQYGFVQALIQRVAYETLSRRDRKAKHLAAADYLSTDSGIDADEIAEVIAAHLLDAVRADPEGGDTADVKARAREWLVRAAERAAALAAPEDAQRAFESAVDLADEPLDRARLLERAGGLARAANRSAVAEAHLRAAFALCDESGASHDRARVAAALGGILYLRGSIEEGLELMEDAFAVLAGEEPDADVAVLAAQLARLHYFAGDVASARERVELALDIAEALRLPAVLASALNTKSLVLSHRRHEAEALLREALRIALDSDLVAEALRAYNNLTVQLDAADRVEEIGPVLEEALALARRRGDRYWEVRLAANLVEDYRLKGEWDVAVDYAAPFEHVDEADSTLAVGVFSLARIAIDRQETERAYLFVSQIRGDLDSSDIQNRGTALWRLQLTPELDGSPDEALAIAISAIPLIVDMRNSIITADLLADMARYAVMTGNHATALDAVAPLEQLPENAHTRAVDSQLFRLRANAAAAAGDNAAAAEAFGIALANARNLNYRYWLAPVLFDYGRWLVATGREDEGRPLLDEARELFEHMGATHWLDRIDALDQQAVVGSRA
jgi:class 3 adenylate cyclase/tetratricopeptide (TPR) repeat protein